MKVKGVYEKQLRFMLNQGAFYKNYAANNQWPAISLQMIEGCFAAHNKPIHDATIVNKVVNTWEFLKTSGST
jgi:uncharacterized lipoprotein YajG